MFSPTSRRPLDHQRAGRASAKRSIRQRSLPSLPAEGRPRASLRDCVACGERVEDRCVASARARAEGNVARVPGRRELSRRAGSGRARAGEPPNRPRPRAIASGWSAPLSSMPTAFNGTPPQRVRNLFAYGSSARARPERSKPTLAVKDGRGLICAGERSRLFGVIGRIV